MRVAIIHDWLIGYTGAEKVLGEMLKLFPEADLFSMVDFMPEEERKGLGGRRSTPSFIQRLPFARTHYRQYLPLMPLAVEQFDLSPYDVVISSCHAVAKGVLVHPNQLHVSYVYTPMRYAWDLQNVYFEQARLKRGVRGLLVKCLMHYLRLWDLRTANGVDVFVAVSAFVGRRIQKVYRRGSMVIHPPVDVDAFPLNTEKEDFYLTVSRVVPYKRVDLIVDAFSRLGDRRLVVIGDGPELRRIRAMAARNVTVLGHQPFDVVRDYMRRAKAFVFAAEEDFGIAPVEAQACGTPVIAYGKGGVTETVINGGTGMLFDEQTAEGLIDKVRKFETLAPQFDRALLRRNAERFGVERFRREFGALVAREWKSFAAADRAPDRDGREQGHNGWIHPEQRAGY